MIDMIFCTVMSEEEAEKATGLKYLELPDEWFYKLSSSHDLNNDEYLKNILKEVDNCDVPMPNVIRDIITGETHSFDRISTGVKVLWLMRYYPNKFLYPSQWLGENCYRAFFELNDICDIVLYEDSDMLFNVEADECVGMKFRDWHTGNIVELGEDRGFLYMAKMRY
jgi:hypothetical protein